jgi:hypothetical protein
MCRRGRSRVPMGGSLPFNALIFRMMDLIWNYTESGGWEEMRWDRLGLTYVWSDIGVNWTLIHPPNSEPSSLPSKKNAVDAWQCSSALTIYRDDLLKRLISLLPEQELLSSSIYDDGDEEEWQWQKDMRCSTQNHECAVFLNLSSAH